MVQGFTDDIDGMGSRGLCHVYVGWLRILGLILIGRSAYDYAYDYVYDYANNSVLIR